jgi:glycerol-3-phosphate O-acyltransferase / dihydroxyacetone phosphate acyltransferase
MMLTTDRRSVHEIACFEEMARFETRRSARPIVPGVLYRIVRQLVAAALRLFYRLEIRAGTVPDGPVMFVGNHPNAMIDPALVFALTGRRVTFLAKAPLFAMPVLGFVMRGLGALPVYRRQDDPAQMGRNEGTLDAAAAALAAGGAITIFPEGRSHSEPGLGALKTGAARIVLRAARAGARVHIVPVGLTYEDKTLFRSEVLIQMGEAIDTAPLVPRDASGEPGAVRAITDRIEEALRAVTLNLEQWEDLPIAQTAEALFALRVGERPRDPERLRAFATGMSLLRTEQPERFDALRSRVAAFGRRLGLVRATPRDLALVYRADQVAVFAARNAAALLLGFPLFALGMAIFAVPYWLVRLIVHVGRPAPDMQATVKVGLGLFVYPLWVIFVAALVARAGGWAGAALIVIGAIPLAVFTRYFFERRAEALLDARTFFVLGNRASLKAALLLEGESLAREIELLAYELRGRVAKA